MSKLLPPPLRDRKHEPSGGIWPLVAGLLLAGLFAMGLLAMGPRIRGIVGHSLLLALLVNAVALPVGSLVAMVIQKSTIRGSRWWLAAFLPLVFLPLYLHVAGWQSAIGVNGWLNPPTAGDPGATILRGWIGAVLVHAAAAVPLVVMVVLIGLAHIDGEAEQAAALCASPRRVMWYVTLPQARSSIALAAIWITVVCTSDISVTDFFGIRTFGEEIYTASAMGAFPSDGSSPEVPLSLVTRWQGLLLGTLAIGSLLVVGLFVGSRAIADRTLQHRVAAWRWPLKTSEQSVATCVVATVWLACVGLPLGSLALEAGRPRLWDNGQPVFEWSASHFAQTMATALRLHGREMVASLALALTVALLASLAATLLAWSARYWPKSKPTIAIGVVLLLALPGPLVGVVLLRLFSQPPDVPMLDKLATLYDRTWIAPLLAQLLRITPIATLIVLAGMMKLPESHLDNARTDGAGWLRILFSVAIPRQWTTIALAGVVAGLLSLGELSATVLVVPAGIEPISVRTFAMLHYGINGRVAALALFLSAVAWLCSAVVLALARRRHR